MSNKKYPYRKSSLLYEDAPVPGRKLQPHERLGLINHAKTKTNTFRMRVEVIEALNNLTEQVNKKINIKISKTQILELLIINSEKQPEKIVELINLK